VAPDRLGPFPVIKARFLVLTVIAGLFVWVFADALFSSGVFVFRDSGHFYYPLFEFVQGEWAAGRVPLWNPYENLGVPLAANATASVFYPGKLVFLLPLDYATAYVWYVMGHVLLAAWAAFRLARAWGASVAAAGAAALSYAFSGNVLYQYCNVIFLVGAAWLPLAVLAACRMLRQDGPGEGQGHGFGGRLRWAAALGCALAVMTLGGNAEMAYHAGLLAAAYALWLWWSERRSGSRVQGSGFRVQDSGGEQVAAGTPVFPLPFLAFSRSLPARPVLLALAVAVALALSAVQVFPSVEFARQSGRAAKSVPRTPYELPGYFALSHPPSDDAARYWSDGLTCRRLEPGSHHEHVYHFSVGPWRLAEYVWPNVSGRQFPVHRRWLDAVPAEGRIWVPSLYMGLVPLVLAVASMRLGGRRETAWGLPRFSRSENGAVPFPDTQQSWLTWMVILAVVASFGWYGLGWLATEIRAAMGADPTKPWLIGGPFGGPYWLATVVLPGYIYFRYPAKLLVIAALGLSMLAAVGWDRAFGEPRVRLRRGLAWLSAASLAAAAVALAVRPFWDGWLAGVEPNVMFGPLDTAGAHRDLLAAFLHTAVVAAVFWWLLGRTDGGARWPATAALLLVAVDLGTANAWMVECAPAALWQEEPTLAAAIAEHEEGLRIEGSEFGVQGSAGSTWGSPLSTLNSQFSTPYRVYRQRLWTLPSWRLTASPDRMTEAARWDRQTLWPKYNLAQRIPLAEVYGTMSPYDYEVFVARRGPPPFAAEGVPDLVALSNVRYYILRGDERLPEGVPIELPGSRALEDVSLWYCPEHLPRAWIVHEVEVAEPLTSAEPAEVRRQTDRVFSADGGPRDLRQSALVELDRQAELEGLPSTGHAAKPSPPAAADGEHCRLTRYDPLCVEIEASLGRPGLVVLCDQYYPGWRLEVETEGRRRTMAVLRVNRVMRGVWLPAGEHRLTYRYRPVSFLFGAGITLAAWIGLGMLLIFGGRRFRVRLSLLPLPRAWRPS